MVIRKICQLDEVPDLNKFKELGFIAPSGCQVVVKMASPRQPLDAPETETEVYSKEVEVEKKGRGVSTKPPYPTLKKTNRGTRLKEDWDIPDDWGEWAVEECSWTVEKVIETGKKFKDHWLSVAGSKGVKLDWFATWRNWCRRTNEGF